MVAPLDILSVPADKLCGQTLTLTCMGPEETRAFRIDFSKQMDQADSILTVRAQAGDPKLSVSGLKPYGQAFEVTLSGGTLNMRAGLKFFLTMASGDIRVFTLNSLILEQGLIDNGANPAVVMGTSGQRGSQEWLSDVDPDESYVPPNGFALLPFDKVINTTTNDLFEYTINDEGKGVWTYALTLKGPKGDIGPAGQIVKVSTVTLDAGQEARVETAGTPSMAEITLYIPKGDKGDTGSRVFLSEGVPGGILTDELGHGSRAGDFALDISTPEQQGYLQTDEKGTWIKTAFHIARGPQGPAGKDGIDGKDGAPGKDGENFTNDGTVETSLKSVNALEEIDAVADATRRYADIYNNGTPNISGSAIKSDGSFIFQDYIGANYYNTFYHDARSGNYNLYSNVSAGSQAWSTYMTAYARDGFNFSYNFNSPNQGQIASLVLNGTNSRLLHSDGLPGSAEINSITLKKGGTSISGDFVASPQPATAVASDFAGITSGKALSGLYHYANYDNTGASLPLIYHGIRYSSGKAGDTASQWQTMITGLNATSSMIVGNVSSYNNAAFQIMDDIEPFLGKNITRFSEIGATQSGTTTGAAKSGFITAGTVTGNTPSKEHSAVVGDIQYATRVFSKDDIQSIYNSDKAVINKNTTYDVPAFLTFVDDYYQIIGTATFITPMAYYVQQDQLVEMPLGPHPLINLLLSQGAAIGIAEGTFGKALDGTLWGTADAITKVTGFIKQANPEGIENSLLNVMVKDAVLEGSAAQGEPAICFIDTTNKQFKTADRKVVTNITVA